MKLKVSQSFYDIVMDFKTPFLILKGGSGSGKSHAITQHIIIHCLSGPHRVLVGRFAGVTLEDSCVQLFKDICSDAGIPYEYTKIDRTMKIGESKISFKAFQDEERIKSLAGYDMAWVEEANEISPDLWDQITLRLRTPGKQIQIIASFNPVSTSAWVYDYFFNKESPRYFFRERKFRIHESTYKDNPYLPAEYVKNLLAMKLSNPMKYRVYALGEWGTLGKLIFPPGTYKIGTMEVPLGTKMLWGCDPGCSDAFSIIGNYYFRDTNTLYTRYELSKSEILCRDAAQWIKSTVPSSCTIWTDNAGKAQIQELQALGCHNVVSNSKPPGDVQARIDKLLDMNWIIHPSCEELIKDLAVYSYKKDKVSGLYLNEPERTTDGRHQNSIDACGYSLQGINNDVKAIKLKNYKGL